MLKSIKGSIKGLLAVMMFCMALNVSIVAFADEQGTVTVDSAKIRASADTSSNQLGSAAKGTTVTIVGETTGTDGKTWYEVYVNDSTTGYIRADLVSKSSSSSSETSTTSSSAVTDMTATTATVSAKSANVRKSASTDSSVVATVSKGVTLTVSGQTTGTDGNTWYKISFKYNDSDVEGYIRADLVTFDEVSNEAAVSEITGEENVEGQTEEAQTEEVQTEEAQTEDSSSDSSTSDIILMNVDEEPYVMPGFELVTLDWNGQEIKAYMNGTFFIFYAQKQNGEEGWYILDREENVYQRYVYTTDGATVPDSSSGASLVVVIALVIIIVIMAAVIGFMAIRMKRSEDEYEYYEDDEDEDDEEDLEELDEEFERPVRRQAQPQSRPVRSPQSQQGSRPAQSQQSQQVRRTNAAQPQQRTASQGQQVRRQPSASQGSTAAGSQQRRPQTQQGAQAQRGATQQTTSSRQGTAQNRTSQNSSRTVQKGQKAKNLLETDDDMDFIDI